MTATAQLELFGGATRRQAGGDAKSASPSLAKGVPPGAGRLLAQLVKRGLPEGDLRVAASLCLALDEGADGKP